MAPADIIPLFREPQTVNRTSRTPVMFTTETVEVLIVADRTWGLIIATSPNPDVRDWEDAVEFAWHHHMAPPGEADELPLINRDGLHIGQLVKMQPIAGAGALRVAA